jgi:tetratricopeptide (TPR) repeat protein
MAYKSRPFLLVLGVGAILSHLIYAQSNTNPSAPAPDARSERGMRVGGSNPEAGRLLHEGIDAMQRGDSTAARDDFLRVTEIDAGFRGAHAYLGLLFLGENEFEPAAQEFRKELALQPESMKVLRMLAATLTRMQKTEEAATVWRKLLDLDPGNRAASASLADMLSETGKSSEAIGILQKALALAPGDDQLQVLLGKASILNGQKDQGVAMVQKAIGPKSSYTALYIAAGALADAGLSLPVARQYAELAMHQAETASQKTGSDDASLEVTRQLGLIWDAVGWVYFRLGYLPQAEGYLRAAWDLTQSPKVGDHLAQDCQSQGHREDAIQIYQEALSILHGQRGEIAEHYEKLTGEKAASAPHATGELIRARTTRILERGKHHIGKATFSLAMTLNDDPEVNYASGDREFSEMAGSIATAQISMTFPSRSKARMLRRGVLTCTKSQCDLKLLTADEAAPLHY